MIRDIEIINFKSHRDTRLKLGNLTVLTGVNSAGKSSVLQTLLLLRQTFKKRRICEGLELEGNLCKIGTVNEALCHCAESAEMSLCFQEDKAEFRFDYDVGEDLGGNFLEVKKDNGIYCRLQSGDELNSGKEIDAILGDISLFNSNFQYVSALRWGGKSHFDGHKYEVEKERQLSFELGQGEAVAHYLYKYGGENATDYLKDDPNGAKEDDGKSYVANLADQVERWERRISKGVTVKATEGEREGFDVFYGYDYPNGGKSIRGLSARNIGYGISHVLPVLVALLSAKPGSLIILENPEAHLHPKGQAELAKLIARAAQAGVQVIVETHSDHIINGILVATKLYEEKKLGIDRNNVKIYYFDMDKDTRTYSDPCPVEIVEHGRLDSQPDGFFDQAEKDLFAIDGI